MARPNFVKLDVYRVAEKLADAVWGVVTKWPRFEKDTLGKQLVRAVDSIGANIADGIGRGSFQDNRRFVRVARGSLHEAQHWLRRAYKRKLLNDQQVLAIRPMIEELGPRLNAYVKSIGPRRSAETNDPQLPTTDNGQRTNAH